MTVREILQYTEVGKEYTSRQIKTIRKANNIFVDSSVGNAMGKLVYQKYFTHVSKTLLGKDRLLILQYIRGFEMVISTVCKTWK